MADLLSPVLVDTDGTAPAFHGLPSACNPMLRLLELNKAFPGPTGFTTVLSGVNLEVKAGQIFGIIGASGAGKSTLIRCVNLLERPTSGRVFVAGRELTALAEKDLVQARREIGMVFQQANLLSSRTVFGNVALPLELTHMPRKEVNTRVSELLERVDLTDKRDFYPAQLSGGQQQRVTIARALASRPPVLLCDEATSALDPATTRSILDLLRRLNLELGLTILLITHEMDVVRRICAEVAIMDRGKVVEQGTVQEIVLRPRTPLARQFAQSARE
jgi:D-methionine transport system ATP-binding protein